METPPPTIGTVFQATDESGDTQDRPLEAGRWYVQATAVTGPLFFGPFDTREQGLEILRALAVGGVA